jgi:CxxC motif-containing protein (DUF1111 family)
MKRSLIRSMWTPTLMLAMVSVLGAQSDPGPRPGPAAAGTPIIGLSPAEAALFAAGMADYLQLQSVQGPQAGQPDTDNTELGLGPRFNSDSCGGCHAQPAAGGSSPALNPQVAAGAKNGASNTLPFFIHTNGPVREVRFKYNPDGSRDGGVHDLFVITGRQDATGCNIQQPNFAAAMARNNLSFRIPTPTFGLGLVEAIQDSTILANMNANHSAKTALGITGHENRNGNDGSITRFGWKAQNKSLLLFTAEAYNVEQGVTNEIFTNERDETPGCTFNGTPEDHSNFDMSNPEEMVSDIAKLAGFMRFLAPPAPIADTPSIANGRVLFNSVGCALCHTPSLQSGLSSSAALSNQTVNLYSDLLVHNMGKGLADDIVQGAAGPDEFRTAPLWGLGQRLFFLHDGRTNDLLQAIEAHSGWGSEANNVIDAFNSKPKLAKQDILNFLRSL